MQALLVVLHSWLRWALLLSLFSTLGSALGGWLGARPWGALQRRLGIVSIALFDTQILLGIALYLVSPYTPHSAADFRASMHDPVLRFYAVEHATGMLLGAILLHVFWAHAKRARSDAARHKRLALGVALALLFVLKGIPWPWMIYGRALFHL